MWILSRRLYHGAVVGLMLAVAGSALAVKPTSVQGVLHSRVVFGAPGFGETPKTDSKVRIYYLELTKGFTKRQLNLPSDDGYYRARYFDRIQLWCGAPIKACERFLRTHLKQRIFAKGVMNYALEPNDHYPVTMDVAGYSLAR